MDSTNEEMITITVKEYEKLKKDAQLLQCLYNAGVDNWEWYGEALNEYNQD